MGLAEVTVGDWTVTDPLVLLVVDHDRQTATTSYVKVPPGTPTPAGLPVSVQLLAPEESRLLGELPHAGTDDAPAFRTT